MPSASDSTPSLEARGLILEGDEFALLIDAVEDYAIFLLSPEGIIRSWNRGATRTMGYQAPEVIGRHFSVFYSAEDLENRKPDRELEVAGRTGRIEDEGWRIRKDGTRFWANTIITALREKDGSVRAFAKVTRDLSERRAAEERLRQSEEMFRLLVQSVQEYAIFLLDPTGHITTWNAGARRIKGYEPEEIIGKHFSTFYGEEDLRSGKPERELKIAREVGMVEDEGWRIRKDGTRFWANVVITAVYDATGQLRGFTKVTRDMTERKHAEETQRALYEQREARLLAEEERRRSDESSRVAQEANRAKDEFLMTLSHELRTPMTAILGWARLLPTLTADDAMFHEAVAAIGRGAQLQARLIDDVLDVSRIVSGKLRLTTESIDVARLIAAAVEAVQPSADAKYITLSTDLGPALGSVIVDPTRIQQVIWNLLTNAVKFTPKYGVVQIQARRTNSRLQISVVDTGEGIEPSFLPHVFEPFRQAENPSTRVHGGLGLGLSIVRYLVEAHGGTVAVESRGRGAGATFTVTLPITSVASGSAPEVRARQEIPERRVEPDRLQGLDIVIVDDDREGREVVRATLRAAGANVVAYDSAVQVMRELERHRPDLLISDIAMPVMDGYALARAIHEKPGLETLPIVALTAFPAGRSAAERSGFVDYLTKPIEPFDLVEAVARAAKLPS
ncbi:MAG: PAS domain S-box protein [Acidobacteria bacterium]|nr:PAS domain S-box protein [Acidobacteriota bacterium]MBV9476108.1 PAS domain S-box protein [Acidobacteriota bacterium]